MVRFLVPFLGAILGCVGGLWLAPHLGGARATPEPATADEATLRDLRAELTEIRRLLERPAGLASAGPHAPGEGGAPGGAAVAGKPGSPVGVTAAAIGTLTPEVLEALVVKAADTALDRREAREKAALKAEEKKRLPLRDVARELSISAAQEADVRKAYQDAGERFLKLMAEPESDAETLRRELEAAKDDPVKRTAIAVRSLPKIFSKLGDVIAITAERDTKIRTAVGAETVEKMKAYKIEEEDPFDLEGIFGGSFGN